MAILYDYHMHSSFSTDSSTPMEQMVQQAICLGLSGVCFTDHMDLDYQEEPGAFEADPDAVLSEILRLREIYDIEISFGLEFGMQAHLPDRFAAIAKAYPLDFIPASCHLVDGRDPFYPQVWENHTATSYIRRYYECFYENILLMKDWDTLAHLDYIIRYIPEGLRADSAASGSFSAADPFVYDSMQWHAELVDALLMVVIDQGKCLEVNTSGYKYGLGQPNPAPAILKRYRELGGERITIGSDAHAPQHIAIAFDQAKALLTELGFGAYTIFRNRKGYEIPLE